MTVAIVRADTPGIRVELNKLEARGNGCRAYLVMRNDTGHTFDTLKLDLVTFGLDSVVARLLAVEAVPLPPGKTNLTVFDIDDLTCDGIDRVLLNDVLACEGDAGARNDCPSLITLASRGRVDFFR